MCPRRRSELSVERSAPRGAVFLSYAREDTDAARRIADALRAAGVEVWFDQSELRGGDAWDQKIKKQIRECALFLPVMSAHTNARAEGYFRLEWLLAVERSRLMAEDAPFLLPVVVDETAEGTARVPDRFRDTQWTRLPAGETPPAFVQRVQTLLCDGSEVETARPRPVEDGKGAAAKRSQPVGRRIPAAAWGVAGLAVVVITFGVVQWLARQVGAESPGKRRQDAAATPAKVTPTTPPVSEARQLVAKARALWEKQDDATRDDWALADQLGKRAVELDPTDGEAWAAYAQVAMGAYVFGFDRTPENYANVLSRANRAVKLAPDSAEVFVAARTRAMPRGLENGFP